MRDPFSSVKTESLWSVSMACYKATFVHELFINRSLYVFEQEQLS